MLPTIETKRLILRPFQLEDAKNIFQLDTNPKVMQFLGGVHLKTIKEAEKTIQYVIQQYEERGIGRYTVIEKSTGKYVGWSGLKLEQSTIEGYEKYYDLGYRLQEEFWGKGYATESSIAFVEFGFRDFHLKEILALVDRQHQASQNVLQKTGLKRFLTVDKINYFYKITLDEYLS